MPWVLAAVCALCVIVVACLLAFATSGSFSDRVSTLAKGTSASSTQRQLDTQSDERESAMRVASQFLLKLNTYGPSDLDKQNQMPGYAAGVEALMSAKFAAGFKSNGLAIAEQSVSQTGYARAAQVFSYGTLSLDSDTATVLVAGSFVGSYPDPKAPNDSSKRITYQAEPFRYAISLVKLGGTWEVDDLTPVTGQASTQQSYGSGSGQPSAPATLGGTNPGSSTPSAHPSQGSGKPSSKPSGQATGKPSGSSSKGAKR